MRLDFTRIRTVLRLSFPVAVSLFAQSVVGLINAAMVGTLGVAQLAGVGVAGVIYAAFTAILFGLDSGIQATIARRSGEGKGHLLGGIVTESLVVSTVVGAALAVACFGFGDTIVWFVVGSPEIAEYGATYLSAISLALVFAGANFAFNAYWNGTGRPKYTLFIALVQLPFSVFFSYLLIFGALGFPQLGVMGAGLGVVIATFSAVLANLYLVIVHRPLEGFMSSRLSFAGMTTVFKVGFPISLEQTTLQVGTIVFFGIIGMIGSSDLAVVNVLVLLEHMSILPAIGVGVITATLVGASLGAGDKQSAHHWGWEGSLVSAAIITPVSTVIFFFPGEIIGLFISDEKIVEHALWPARFYAIAMLINSAGRVLGYGLRGAGATTTVATINFSLNWIVQLPMAWALGVWLEFGLYGVTLGRVALVTVEALILATVWRKGRWSDVQIADHQEDPVFQPSATAAGSQNGS